ncbi:amino acid transporter [Zavarzinella formosa]|uniref:amino acid transporter n=1 Tax=Zavarzinella formosa TaxID=360055 RepID=UPI0002D5F0ED|nr:amino acid transporter [Zavarzinella formosa]
MPGLVAGLAIPGSQLSWDRFVPPLVPSRKMSNPSSPTPTSSGGHHQSFWLGVMCLTGVDYFSTLGYQPSIAVESAGLLAPLATIVLVLVTLFGALPVYCYVAGKSFEGQGSIGMLAKLLSGWPGKILVLTLLGFAATDFVITKTLSAADAAEHLINNPYWPLDKPKSQSEHGQIVTVTMLLLVLLGATFMRGFKEVIGIAAVIVTVYLLLNVIVIAAGLSYLNDHPERFTHWLERVRAGDWYLEESPSTSTGFWATIAVSVLLFPKLALGLSGFETGVAVMAHIKGREDDEPKKPRGRITNTRKLLLCAAVIMSVALLGSSLIVSTLVPPEAITTVNAKGEPPLDANGKPIEKKDREKPPANARALAYLAHGEGPEKISPIFGNAFGTIYDISTIIILWFAGASAMAGLLNLVPQYLPKYGMAPEWAQAIRPLVLMFTGINLLVTWIFKASVEAQGDAYATGVLVLMTSACIASVIDLARHKGLKWRLLTIYFALITAVFVFTTADNIYEKSAGIKIASFFIVTILFTSIFSRVSRSRELRFSGFHLPDVQSRLLWDTLRHLELSVLVPHRPGRRTLEEKEQIIRREHRIPPEMMVVFVEVELYDASEFNNLPTLKIRAVEGKYILHISKAASISHTLAALALEMAKVGRPPEIHFGWTDESPMSGTLGFLLFGEGNVPWMVRELIRRAEPNQDRRPLIIIAGQ